MTIQVVRTYPDPILREKCEEVEEITDEIKELIQDLKDTCKAYQAHGLAAPQIGVAKRVFVTRTVSGEPQVYINPVLTDLEDPGYKMEEGCLSFPGVLQVIERWGDITVTAMDEEGEPRTHCFDEMGAVAIQHELDHLNGVLFIDHVRPLTRRFMLKKLKKATKKPTKKKPQPSKRAKARKERKRQKTHRKSA